MFSLRGSMEHMFRVASEPLVKKWAYHGQHNSSVFPCSPTISRLSHYILVCFGYVMGGAEAWARNMSSLTPATPCTPDCMNLVPVLLTWHSTLYNRDPLQTKATYNYRLLGEGWAGQ
jgi:hypothetical protein